MTFLSMPGKTIKVLSFLQGSFCKSWAINFVLIFSNLSVSRTTKKFFWALADKTINKAARFIFRLIFLLKFLSLVGPKAIPPCLQIGDLVEPCLARPVPFCLQGFLPPPETLPLPFVWSETCRRL